MVLVLSQIGVVAGGAAPSSDGSGALEHPSRDRLAICVQAMLGAQVADVDARQRVLAVLQEFSARASWSALRIPARPFVVGIGCPGVASLLESDAVTVETSRGPVVRPSPRDRTVDTPSMYRIHIYVLPDVVADSYLRGSPFAERGFTEERIRISRDVFQDVTTGVYLTRTGFSEPSFLATVLGYYLGLPLTGPPPETQPGFRGTEGLTFPTPLPKPRAPDRQLRPEVEPTAPIPAVLSTTAPSPSPPSSRSQ